MVRRRVSDGATKVSDGATKRLGSWCRNSRIVVSEVSDDQVWNQPAVLGGRTPERTVSSWSEASSRWPYDGNRQGRVPQLTTQTKPGLRSRASTPGAGDETVTRWSSPPIVRRRIARARRKKCSVDPGSCSCASALSRAQLRGCGSQL